MPDVPQIAPVSVRLHMVQDALLALDNGAVVSQVIIGGAPVPISPVSGMPELIALVRSNLQTQSDNLSKHLSELTSSAAPPPV